MRYVFQDFVKRIEERHTVTRTTKAPDGSNLETRESAGWWLSLWCGLSIRVGEKNDPEPTLQVGDKVRITIAKEPLP